VAGSSAADPSAAVGIGLMAKVLIEDDRETVEWSADGIERLDKAWSSHPDAMIVDRLLP